MTEEKDEKVEVEETSSENESTEETTDQAEEIESASTVETDPVVESDKPIVDLVQLEQRVTSLEQRLLATESQPAEQAPPPQDNGDTSIDENSEDDSEMESTDDIKKILEL